MGRTKTEEKTLTEQSPKKKSSVCIHPFKFFEKYHNKKSLEGRKLQTAISGTEHTVTTETGKTKHRNFISDPIIFQKKKEKQNAHRKMELPSLRKSKHCLRGVDGKYIQWNEILRDVLNRKLKIMQNKKTKIDTEGEEGEVEDEEGDFENHGTSEKDGYRPITTSPEDELNLYTDGELITGENKESIITTGNKNLDSQTGKVKNRIDTGGVTYTRNFGI